MSAPEPMDWARVLPTDQQFDLLDELSVAATRPGAPSVRLVEVGRVLACWRDRAAAVELDRVLGEEAPVPFEVTGEGRIALGVAQWCALFAPSDGGAS